MIGRGCRGCCNERVDSMQLVRINLLYRYNPSDHVPGIVSHLISTVIWFDCGATVAYLPWLDFLKWIPFKLSILIHTRISIHILVEYDESLSTTVFFDSCIWIHLLKKNSPAWLHPCVIFSERNRLTHHNSSNAKFCHQSAKYLWVVAYPEAGRILFLDCYIL